MEGPMAGKGMLRIQGEVLELIAQHILIDTKVAGDLSHRHAPLLI
ncbi:hypothetical protein J2S73_001380 [Amorphus orientalis]|uniref:Uncharacterized protein n=1 Tax=Amorphus orientalis TaxID=649198 RepID=A0AAE3VN25_9HYPH|nr:hypothetical protein [Amorphus orientalis]